MNEPLALRVPTIHRPTARPNVSPQDRARLGDRPARKSDAVARRIQHLRVYGSQQRQADSGFPPMGKRGNGEANNDALSTILAGKFPRIDAVQHRMLLVFFLFFFSSQVPGETLAVNLSEHGLALIVKNPEESPHPNSLYYVGRTLSALGGGGMLHSVVVIHVLSYTNARAHNHT